MSEPSLREFQQWMKARIRAGHAAAATTALHSDEVLLNAQGGVPGVERVAEVYGGGYRTRIREALAEVYEAVRFVLGESRFAELANTYAERFPSHDYNLSFAGRHLPELLAGWPLTQELPFLPDLARLEWLVCQAFHAFDEPPADLAPLAAMPVKAWAQVRLRFQPSVGLIASAWPIRDIWAARSGPRGTVNVKLVNQPQRVLVCRRGVTVTCELLEEDAFALLQRLAAGEPLGAACGALARQAAGEPPLAAWFARWAGQGLIRQIERA